MDSASEKMLTVDEAAAITGLKPTTLRNLAWQRKITSYKVLSATRFKQSDLEKLIVKRPAITDDEQTING